MAGKGDKQRPRQVSYAEWSRNWDAAFAVRKQQSSDKRPTHDRQSSDK